MVRQERESGEWLNLGVIVCLSPPSILTLTLLQYLLEPRINPMKSALAARCLSAEAIGREAAESTEQSGASSCHTYSHTELSGG